MHVRNTLNNVLRYRNPIKIPHPFVQTFFFSILLNMKYKPRIEHILREFATKSRTYTFERRSYIAIAYAPGSARILAQNIRTI